MKEESATWWKQSLEDLDSAKVNFENRKYYVAAFLSQQAIEKALKAILIENTDNFPRIHNIVELSRKVAAPKEITEHCAKVNPAYTATRYPDVAMDFDKGEVEELIQSTVEVLAWAGKELKS